MNWLKAIGYGVILFAIGFLIGSIAMFGLKLSGVAMSLVMLVIMIVVTYLLAVQYKIKGLNQGLQVGLVWLIVEALLDYIVIVQIFNNGDGSKFYSGLMYLSYLLILAIPAGVGQMAKKA